MAIHCKNVRCRHYQEEGCGNSDVIIGKDGKCRSFEKGISHYFLLVWDALSRKNYIDMVELNLDPDLRIGLFYVMECYHLGFSEMEWGTCRMFLLKDGETGKALNAEEILEREIDEEKFRYHYTNFASGRLPGQGRREEKAPLPAREFGWLSPSGVFTESPFGKHEESAEEICKAHGFLEEYQEWRRDPKNTHLSLLYRDFLMEKKGYALIHNPSGDGGYVVTSRVKLTKAQREFLYDYFLSMGDRFKAEQYI